MRRDWTVMTAGAQIVSTTLFRFYDVGDACGRPIGAGPYLEPYFRIRRLLASAWSAGQRPIKRSYNRVGAIMIETALLFCPER
jgi:hypothetical protein